MTPSLSTNLQINFTRKEVTILFAIILCYLCAGLIAIKYHSVLSIFERDGTEFLFDAKRIVSGQGYDSDFWPFGYMLGIAFFNFVLGMDFFLAAKFITSQKNDLSAHAAVGLLG